MFFVPLCFNNFTVAWKELTTGCKYRALIHFDQFKQHQRQSPPYLVINLLYMQAICFPRKTFPKSQQDAYFCYSKGKDLAILCIHMYFVFSPKRSVSLSPSTPVLHVKGVKYSREEIRVFSTSLFIIIIIIFIIIINI